MNEQETPIPAVPVQAVVLYLQDIARQLENLAGNINQNIKQLTPIIEGEATNASSNKE
jgi:hypothetical protein